MIILRGLLLLLILGLLSPRTIAFTPEQARAKLESLYQQDQIVGNAGNRNSDTPSITPLTSMARRQREVEMDLLLKLARSNDALHVLDQLWASEQNMDPEAVKAASNYEQALKAFQEGDLGSAYTLALKALKRKPWHIPTNYLMFNIAWKQADVAQAKYWARRCMPRSPFHKRRQEWVVRVAKQAKMELQKMEENQVQFWESANDWQ